jgi:hypothetical protein
MKKIILFLVGLFIYQITSYAQEYRKDSTYQFSWGSSTFVNNARNYFEYDNGGTAETNYIVKYGSGDNFTNNKQTIKIYNSDNLLIEEINQNWNADEWDNNSKKTYVLNADGKPTSIEQFSFIDNDWVIFSAETNTYTASSDEVTVTKIIKKLGSADILVNKEKYICVYNSDELIEVEIKQIWLDDIDEWQNDEKTTYHYNSNNKISNTVNENWRLSDQDWFAFEQTILEYNAAGLKSQQNEQIRHVGVWKDTRIQTFAYDANDNLIELIIQDCNFIRQTCENTARHSYTYTPFNEEECYILELWNDTTGEWRNYQKRTTYWSEAFAFALSTENNTIAENDITIFPNPINSSFKINSSINLENTTLKLYNTLGSLVKTILIKRPQIFNISELSKGVYFLKLDANNNNKIQKTYKIIKD